MDHGLKQAAAGLLSDSDVIDLHVDGFIPHRLFGYDLTIRHSGSYTRGRFVGHLDFPRAVEYGLTGAMWSITTNPLPRPRDRWRSFLENVQGLQREVERSEGMVQIATNWSDYMKVRESGAHVCLPAIQGANSLEGAPGGCGEIPNRFITRATLVHLTNSVYGTTSSPLSLWRSKNGLTWQGRDLVRDLDRHRIFVDLAHINKEGFWDAVQEHDPSLPLIVTHTGVEGVRPHWRNLDDDQIRAVADSGGTIGIIFEPNFLRRSTGPKDGAMVLEHLAHIIHVVGEDFVSLGSDYDGMISPPEGLRFEPNYAYLVMGMLERNWSMQRIQKILGGNFLRAFKAMRPD